MQEEILDDFRRKYVLRQFSEIEYEKECNIKHKYQSYSNIQDSNLLKDLGTDSNVTNVEIQYAGITPDSIDIKKHYIKNRLIKKWNSDRENIPVGDNEISLTPLQQTFLPFLTSYRDLSSSICNSSNINEIRSLIALHSLNHVLKCRDLIIRNNERLKQKTTLLTSQGDLEYRDQGFTRPTVLILAPFRSSALAIVEEIIKILPESVKDVINQDRFLEEFSCENDEEEDPSILDRKPQDWKDIFKGNHDDCFQIGISFSRQTMRIYTDYYNSDIIIASPIALRMSIGADGEKNQDYDFLSSIHIVAIEQADVLKMQNWNHVLDIFKVLNLIPKKSLEVDFSRVREWNLSGYSKYFRQTLLFSSFNDSSFNSLFNHYCFNLDGTIRLLGRYSGSLSYVIPQVKQIFQRISTESITKSIDSRFNYFESIILQGLLKHFQKYTLIYIPSYFDFVRIRNLFRKEQVNFCSCSEYCSLSDISRAKTRFRKGECNIMLYSGRFHFFRRHRIRGIYHLIFYGLPFYSNFYPEMLNLLEQGNGHSIEPISSLVLYTKYDFFQLERVCGSIRAKKMIQKEKETYLFC